MKLRQRQASNSSREQPPRPQSPAGQRLPHGLTAPGLDRGHAGLAPLAPFDQALERLQAVNVIAVEPAVAHADHFLDLGSPGQLDRGDAPGDRQRRAGHERKAHRVGRIDHLLGPVPLPREVLVVEDRHSPARSPEDLDDLLEELVAGIERLPSSLRG